MIRVHCHTNLDEYRYEKWPETFVALPRVGDTVVSTSSRKELQVIQVKHSIDKITLEDGYTAERPCVIVELHRKKCL